MSIIMDTNLFSQFCCNSISNYPIVTSIKMVHQVRG